MAGGKARPRHDKGIKVSNGQLVKTGQILVRAINLYKAGSNVRGLDTLYALCSGKIYFTRRKTSHGRVRTFVNIVPEKKQKED